MYWILYNCCRWNNKVLCFKRQLILWIEGSCPSIQSKTTKYVVMHFASLIWQKISHNIQRVLQRFGISRGTRVVGRKECGYAEYDFIGMRIVGCTVAPWCDWSISHEAVGRAGNLNCRIWNVNVNWTEFITE